MVVPASTEPGLTERLAVEAAARGQSVTFLSPIPTELDGVTVLVWDDDLSHPDRAARRRRSAGGLADGVATGM